MKTKSKKKVSKESPFRLVGDPDDMIKVLFSKKNKPKGKRKKKA